MLPRKLRTRLASASRPVAVRARTAWYWQALGLVVLVSLSMAVGHWLYDFTRGVTTRDHDQPQTERSVLQTRLTDLEAELGKLRALVETNDSRMQVERVAQSRTQQQLKSLEDDNIKLKEELAFFENLMPGGKDDRLSIYRFTVEPSGSPGEYRYRMLVMNGGGREAREFQGSFQLVVNLERDAKRMILTLPDSRPIPDPYRLNFKRVQRIEGVFKVEPESRVRTVQVRLLENGSGQPRASESVSLAAHSSDQSSHLAQLGSAGSAVPAWRQ